MEILVAHTPRRVTSEKLLNTITKRLTIATEAGDRTGKGRAYKNQGNVYLSLVDFRQATEYQEKHSNIAVEVGDRGNIVWDDAPTPRPERLISFSSIFGK